jgi:hypothetical protein
MADQSLQAFQLGANLFDRAQTQARMMEQFQQQTAESLLQRQGMELQNKIRDMTLADAIGEQKAQVEEFNAFSDLSKQVGDYLDNPTPDSKFPLIPAFKSKQYRVEADRMLNNLEKYSQRAMLLKARDNAANSAASKQAQLLNKAAEIGAVVLDQNGNPQIDWNEYNARTTAKFQADIGSKQATAQATLDRVGIAQANLERLIAEGKNRSEIQNATLALREEIGRANLALREELGRGQLQQGEQRLKLSEELGRGRLAQGAERIDIAREKAESAKTSSLKPTKLDLDELEFSEAVLNGIKPMEPYLAEDLYGPTFNIRVKAGEAIGSFGPERQVNQLYENMSSGAMFKRGGKSLTKSETTRITSSIGKPTDTGFSERVQTFKELTARSIKDRVEKLRMQGIDNNPQYSAYINELERRADEILGVETAPQQQSEIRSFNSIQEAQSANLPVGTRISVGGRPATIK